MTSSFGVTLGAYLPLRGDSFDALKHVIDRTLAFIEPVLLVGIDETLRTVKHFVRQLLLTSLQ